MGSVGTQAVPGPGTDPRTRGVLAERGGDGAGEEVLRDCAERLDALAAEVARVLRGRG
ncbi:hypothetical protein [Streptomyces albidoflavus]|uniref:hypothetical protein n=1 Tax=Streptomyces albidoflavus TaxID=1886 RepID=UPI001596DC65|nr:hypothetical protein [Streptomyces albidoflavus]MBF4132868.1 hypothetical protein [Streptomyces albidoflavus]